MPMQEVKSLKSTEMCFVVVGCQQNVTHILVAISKFTSFGCNTKIGNSKIQYECSFCSFADNVVDEEVNSALISEIVAISSRPPASLFAIGFSTF